MTTLYLVTISVCTVVFILDFYLINKIVLELTCTVVDERYFIVHVRMIPEPVLHRVKRQSHAM